MTPKCVCAYVVCRVFAREGAHDASSRNCSYRVYVLNRKNMKLIFFFFLDKFVGVATVVQSPLFLSQCSVRNARDPS